MAGFSVLQSRHDFGFQLSLFLCTDINYISVYHIPSYFVKRKPENRIYWDSHRQEREHKRVTWLDKNRFDARNTQWKIL